VHHLNQFDSDLFQVASGVINSSFADVDVVLAVTLINTLGHLAVEYPTFKTYVLISGLSLAVKNATLYCTPCSRVTRLSWIPSITMLRCLSSQTLPLPSTRAVSRHPLNIEIGYLRQAMHVEEKLMGIFLEVNNGMCISDEKNAVRLTNSINMLAHLSHDYTDAAVGF
jgi:hypothetical protein